MRHAHRFPSLSMLLALVGLAACGEDGQSPTAPSEAGGPAFTQIPGRVVVNSLADPGDGICDATQCTLREAIKATGSTRISFKSGLTGTITLARPGAGGGTLVIDKSLAITGPDVRVVIQRRSTDPAFRIVRIAGRDTVRLTNLILRKGADTTGGGIINFGHLALTNCTVTGNSALRFGGGIDNHGWLSVTDSRVANNSEEGIFSDGNLMLNRSVVTGNSGGGIFSRGQLTLASSVVSDNNGSGISIFGFTFRDISTVITNSTISGNSTEGDGGAIANDGGARLTIIKSTLEGNSADAGGAIFTRQGLRDDRGVVIIRNSTISGNAARFGGAIYGSQDGADDDAVAGIYNSTITRNSASEGGGIHLEGGLVVSLRNTIVAQNRAVTGPDLFGPGTDALFSLIGDGSTSELIDGVGGTRVGTTKAPIDPKLAPLADYGGPTRTHQLLLGSPAIDAASSADCAITDQRGVQRPQGAACDIGSFERAVR
ncbi:MAG TPA: choice-of-anchor Q domain-containing protein [Gemmatimonadales bacterium]|nr:choice-of-anchor Q domain-containing protein [Gemmatimonadales bacterium]